MNKIQPHSVTVTTSAFDAEDEGSNPSEVATYLYRFDGVCYAAPADECGDPQRGKGDRRLHLTKYTVTKRTAKGVWINHGNGKFVNLTAKKQFACRSKVEAMQSFLARKRVEASILRSRLEDVHTFMELARMAKYDE